MVEIKIPKGIRGFKSPTGKSIEELLEGIGRLKQEAATFRPETENVHFQTAQGFKPEFETPAAEASDIPKGIDPTREESSRILPTGTGLEDFAGSIKYSPNLYLFTKPSVPEVYQLAEGLTQAPFALEKNRKYLPTEFSIEEIRKHAVDGIMGEYHRLLDQAFNKMRIRRGGQTPSETVSFPMTQSLLRSALDVVPDVSSHLFGTTPPMTKGRFKEEVAKVKRRWIEGEPSHPDPEVVQMVKYIHDKVLDPILKKGGELGYFREELVNDEARRKSYLPQVWIPQAVMEKQPEFVDFLLRNSLAKDGKTLEDISPEELQSRRTALDQTALAIMSSHDGILREITPTGSGKREGEGKKRSGRERTIDLHPSMLDEAEQYLENDLDRLLYGYVRSITSDLTKLEKFGSLDLSDHFAYLDERYNQKAHANAGNPRKVLQVNLERGMVKKYLQALWEIESGTLGLPDNPYSVWYRASNFLLQWNVATKLGNVVVNSLSDPGRHILRHGLRHFVPLIFQMATSPIQTVKSMNELRLLANIYELYMANRFLELSELTGRYRRGNWAERAMSLLSDNFGLISLLSPWDHGNKSVTAMIAGHKVINHALRIHGGKPVSDLERRILAEMGLSATDLWVIAEQFKKHGKTSWNGIRFLQAADWDMEAASVLNRLGLALRREADRVANMPTAGSRPLWTKGESVIGEAGKHLAQFQSFTITALEKIALPMLQHKDMRLINGLVLGVALGALSYVLNEIKRGRDKDEILSEDPEKIILEGIDRSGYLMALSNLNGIAEQAGGFGLSTLIGDESMMSRYSDRTALSSVFGPSVGTVSDVFQSAHGAAAFLPFTDHDARLSDVRAFRRLWPLQNHVILRGTFDRYEEALADELEVYR